MAERVSWVVAEITEVDALGTFETWHDRAVFHFLTAEYDRWRYARLAERTVPSGGHLVIASFAPEGPDRCSGLESGATTPRR